MKVVQVHSAFLPVIGGVENYAHSLCQELVKKGQDVTVVTSTLGIGKKVRVEQIDGIKVKRLNYIFKIGGTPVIPGLYSELRRIDADVIHAHLPTPYTADIACFIAKQRNIPCILTYHNDIVGRGINKYIAKAYNSLALKTLLGNADKIISTQPQYVELSPYLKNYKYKIIIIPCGVDVDKFKPLRTKKKKNSIFFLSVLNKSHGYKGLDYLLRALVQVKKEIPDVKLIVGGQGN